MDAARTDGLHVVGTNTEITMLGERLLNVRHSRCVLVPAVTTALVGARCHYQLRGEIVAHRFETLTDIRGIGFEYEVLSNAAYAAEVAAWVLRCPLTNLYGVRCC